MSIKKLPKSPKKLGSAKFLGVFETHSEGWYAARAGENVGGSDVAPILGLSPWVSPFTLWAKKTGKISEQSGSSDAMEWGSRLEPAVLQKFADSHPDWQVFDDCGTWFHETRTWQVANPDAIFVDENGEQGLVEIKTSLYADDWRDGVPAYYRTQVQWYLQTFGLSKAVVAVFFLANRQYKEFEIEADFFEQETNLEAVTRFRENYVLADLQPDFDGAANTYETLREIHPDIDDTESVDLGDLGMHYQLALAEHAKSEAFVTELKSRVLDAMGNAKTGHVDGEVIVQRTSRAGGKPYLTNKK